MTTTLYLHEDTGLHALWYGHHTQALEDALYALRLEQLQRLIKQRIDETLDTEDQ